MDKFTDEHREALRKMFGENSGTESGRVSSYGDPEDDRLKMVEHLKQELAILFECCDDDTAVGLAFYAQAVTDLEHFIKYGTSAREAQNVSQRMRNATQLVAQSQPKTR